MISIDDIRVKSYESNDDQNIKDFENSSPKHKDSSDGSRILHNIFSNQQIVDDATATIKPIIMREWLVNGLIYCFKCKYAVQIYRATASYKSCKICKSKCFYLCAICKKKFPRFKYLRVHLQSECGKEESAGKASRKNNINRFKCEKCCFEATDTDKLRDHMKKVHFILDPNDFFLCKKCEKPFSSRCRKVAHEKYCGIKLNLKCTNCHYETQQIEKLREHIRMVHKQF